MWVADFDPAAVALGTPQKITSISTEAGGELWSPDGKYILFTSDVYPDCPDDACNKARDEQKAKSQVKATIFRGLFFRHWSNYTGDKRTHIFIQAVEPTSAPSTSQRAAPRARCGAPARDLTPGDHDAPPFSLGGQDMYAFSPDSQEVAFTSNIDEVEATSHQQRDFRGAGRGRHAEEDFHLAGLGFDAAVFARWEVHRVAHAGDAGVRERSLPVGAVRAQDGADSVADEGF